MTSDWRNLDVWRNLDPDQTFAMIMAMERDLKAAVEAARWCNEHRGDWDGPAISPEERWPSVFQGGE